MYVCMYGNFSFVSEKGVLTKCPPAKLLPVKPLRGVTAPYLGPNYKLLSPFSLFFPMISFKCLFKNIFSSVFFGCEFIRGPYVTLYGAIWALCSCTRAP